MIEQENSTIVKIIFRSVDHSFSCQLILRPTHFAYPLIALAYPLSDPLILRVI